MGTTYTQLRQGDKYLEIDEHSNRFCITAADLDGRVFFDDITPAELLNLAAKMANVASYWMDDLEFRQAMKREFGVGVDTPPWQNGGCRTGG